MEITQRDRINSYSFFLTADAVLSFAVGLFGPFWILFIQGFGDSVESLGLAVGLRLLAYSFTAYFAGRLSDKSGRKILMIEARLASAIIVLSYTWITSLSQLYTLQMLFGIIGAVDYTATSAFLGDITEKESRGKDIGKFNAVTGITGAIALMIGGVVAGKFGMELIFYVVAALYCVSYVFLLFIKEDRGSAPTTHE